MTAADARHVPPSHRGRRTRWLCVVLALAGAACTGDAVGSAPIGASEVAPTSSLQAPDTTPETATPEPDTTAMSSPASPETTTPATTTVSSTAPSEISLPAVPCSLAAVGTDHVLVFGNSTDYTFRADEPIEMTAWPELLAASGDPDLLSGVSVRNEAQPGQTMGIWDAWGPEPELRLTRHAVSVLDAMEASRLAGSLAIVAPSFIDLQENGFDADRAVVDLSVVLATLQRYGLEVLVLPMNYVSTALNERFPELNPAVQRFNDILSDRGMLAEPLIDSPLRASDGPVGGDDTLYDDFPGRDRDGTFLGADGFHPDAEGQYVKSLAVIEVLSAFVERTAPTAVCT